MMFVPQDVRTERHSNLGTSVLSHRRQESRTVTVRETTRKLHSELLIRKSASEVGG